MTIAYPTQAPEALERRPEARAYKIEDLLAEVQRGRVRIPPFQRKLVWEREDAQKLIDSLYRGYPVGTLLFWETDAPAIKMSFGSISIATEKRSDALWIVDGQQRITSLVRVLSASEANQDEFALYFDLDNIEFVQPPSLKDLANDSTRWLPMTEVLDSERLIQWIINSKSSAITKERQDKAIQVGKRIREYEVPAYIVRTDSEDILREVFSRVNTAGKSLKWVDVFDALHGSRSQVHPSSIQDIVVELQSLDFGRVEDKTLYKLLRVLHGASVIQSKSEGPLRLPPEQAQQAYQQTADVAKRVIQFIKHESGIPHYDLLPYKIPLITLGKFFSHHPNPSPRSQDLLVRWLWRGALNGAHQGDTTSTSKGLARIDSVNEDLSIQQMLEMVDDRPDSDLSPIEPFNFRYSNSKLQALALLALGPRDLETGKLLTADDLLADNEDQNKVFPQVITYNQNSNDVLFRSAANRLAHPQRQGGLRRLLLAVSDPELLTSHGITEPAIQALRVGNYIEFLRLRSAHLQTHYLGFFAQYTRWDEPDRPALSALYIADEDD